VSDENSGGQGPWTGREWNADPVPPAPQAHPQAGADAQPTQNIAGGPASSSPWTAGPAPQPYQQPSPQPQAQPPYQQQAYPQQPAQQQPPQAHIPQPANYWGAAGATSNGPQYQQYQYEHPEPESAAPPFDTASTRSASGAARRNPRLIWGGGIAGAVVVAIAAVLLFTQSSGAATGAHASAAAKPTPTPSGFQPKAGTPAAEAAQTAGVFLDAWQGGDFQLAASYTDDPSAAQSTLSAFRTGLGLDGLQVTPGASTAAGVVDFTVKATVASTGTVDADASGGTTPSPAASSSGGSSSGSSSTAATGTWTYTSHLTAYQKNGGWWIKWDPSLVAPGMTASLHPVALAIRPTVASVTDADGDSLSASSQSALVNIAALIKQNTTNHQGTAGLEIALENSSGAIASGTTSVLSNATSSGSVTTTIDPHIESLAISAVGQLPRSAMVVLRPSTGAILAVANSAGSADYALTGTLAPGSSFKVVTTTGLLVDGMLPQGINTQVGCPLVEDVQGVKIHNSTTSANSSAGTEDFEPNNTPFSTDFAQSCNNAFTQWWQVMDGGKLADAASTYYGLNQEWDLGLGSKGTYFSMPSDQSGSELAEELYGQGLIEANPLSMASIAATVDTGDFHQPYLVAGVTDKASATPLPSSVQTALYSVMREVVTSGTAAGVGFGAGVYGKTGTAEAAANKDNNPNGWMIVFDPSQDIAIAAVVIDSNFGASTAGPEVNYVLQHL
jgi:hypothetical protein